MSLPSTLIKTRMSWLFRISLHLAFETLWEILPSQLNVEETSSLICLALSWKHIPKFRLQSAALFPLRARPL